MPQSLHLDGVIANNGGDIANLFSKYFSSVYKTNPEIPSHPNINRLHEYPLPSHCNISLDEVTDGLRSLLTSKSPGPDGISGYFLARCTDSISFPIYILYSKSLVEGVFPSAWKTSSITPVFKKGDKTDIKNYRPISGLVQIGKLLEKLVLKKICKPINNILDYRQYGFRAGCSTITCNLSFHNFIMEALKENSQVDVIFTDFEKAFDRVNHELLLIALNNVGFGDPLLSWFKSYLTNKIQFTRVQGFNSTLTSVPSGTPQGGHLSPLLFLIFINDISSVLNNCQFLLFADDLKIYTRVSSINDCVILQNELNVLFDWCKKWGMSLNISKCYSMSFYRSRSPLQFVYSINNISLGISFSYQRSWDNVFIQLKLSPTFRDYY